MASHYHNVTNSICDHSPRVQEQTLRAAAAELIHMERTAQ